MNDAPLSTLERAIAAALAPAVVATLRADGRDAPATDSAKSVVQSRTI